MPPNIAIIGASANRQKYSNRAVRAYRAEGYTVYPINPNAEEIERLKASASVLDVPGEIELASLYLPPKWGLSVAEGIIAKGIPEVLLNPGAESPELADKLKQAGVNVILGCSIIALGRDPAEFGDC